MVKIAKLVGVIAIGLIGLLFLYGVVEVLISASPFQMMKVWLHPEDKATFTCTNGVGLTIDTHTSYQRGGFGYGSDYVHRISYLTFAIGNKSVQLDTKKNLTGLGVSLDDQLDSVFVFSSDIKTYLIHATDPGWKRSKGGIVYEGFLVDTSKATANDTKKMAECLTQHTHDIPELTDGSAKSIGFIVHSTKLEGSIKGEQPNLPAHTFNCAADQQIKLGGGSERPSMIRYISGNTEGTVEGYVGIDGSLPTKALQDFAKQQLDIASCIDTAGVDLPQYLSRTAPAIVLVQ